MKRWRGEKDNGRMEGWKNGGLEEWKAESLVNIQSQYIQILE
jgi:hypothetical protein